MSVSRRSFLVVCGGALLGTFNLPERGPALDSEASAAATPAVPTVIPVKPLDRIRRMLTCPQWGTKRTGMCWMEVTPENKVTVMVWRPETPEEWAEAERFYAAASYRTWTTFEDLRTQALRPGAFVIRWIFQPNVRGYVIHSDESLLFSDDPEQVMFDLDPHMAATFNHARAIDLTLRLMTKFKWEEGGVSYFDTISLDEAMKHHETIAKAEHI